MSIFGLKTRSSTEFLKKGQTVLHNEDFHLSIIIIVVVTTKLFRRIDKCLQKENESCQFSVVRRTETDGAIIFGKVFLGIERFGGSDDVAASSNSTRINGVDQFRFWLFIVRPGASSAGQFGFLLFVVVIIVLLVFQ